MLPKGYKIVLDWFQEVVAGGEEYENPEVVIEEVVQREEEITVNGNREKVGGVEGEGEGVESEESNGEGKVEEREANVHKGDESKAMEVSAEEPIVKESRIEEAKVEELSAGDSYTQGLDEAEEKSCMDWGEEVWEEEMKKRGLKMEDREDPRIGDEKYKVEQVKGEGAERDGTMEEPVEDIATDGAAERLQEKGLAIHSESPETDAQQ